MKTILIFMMTFLSFSTWTMGNAVTIKVKGLVCSFCAQGIEKKFNETKEVKETKVNLDKMEVTLKYSGKNRLSEKKMKEIMTSAGFSFVGVKK